MTEAQQSIDAAIEQIERLRKSLKKGNSKQVQSDNERQLIKATAYAWFNNNRNCIAKSIGTDGLEKLDGEYRELIAASSRAALRSRYQERFKLIKKLLVQVQADEALALSSAQPTPGRTTTDAAPHFSPLVSDARMQAILTARWQECFVCIESGAPLASTVMMGGLLEGLLLARINQLSDKSFVFKAAAAPKDKKRSNTLGLKDWTLKNYIEVAHELGWISQTTKDIGVVVRNYRNYIHPQKEYSHGITISPDDARMLWEVAKSITRQLLKP